VCQEVVENEVRSPRKFNPSVPEDLELIALKCLEKEQERRYPSARALAEMSSNVPSPRLR